MFLLISILVLNFQNAFELKTLLFIKTFIISKDSLNNFLLNNFKFIEIINFIELLHKDYYSTFIFKFIEQQNYI